MGDKCKHGYKDGEYCIQCDRPEYIKALEAENKELKAKLEGAEEENCMLQNQLDIQPSFSSAEEQEAHFTLTESVAERLREKGE